MPGGVVPGSSLRLLEVTVEDGHGYRVVVGLPRQVEEVRDAVASIGIVRRGSRLDVLEIGWGDACLADDAFGSGSEVTSDGDDVARELL